MKRRLTLVSALVLVLWLGLPGFWAGETGGRAHAYVPPRVPGGSALCPALPPPSGPAVTVSSEAELRDQAYNAASGTTILVAAGTFYLQDTVHVVHDGITIRGATGNRDAVILDAGGMGSGLTHAILIEADDVTVADLTIRNAGEHGVSINGRDRPKLYNLHILDTGYQLVKVNPVGDGSDDGLLACSRLEYTATAPGEYTNGISAHNAHRWVVRDNAWYRIRTPGGTPVPTILFWSASSGTVVERNLLVNCYQGISFGNASHGSGDHSGGIVRNNFIYAALPHDVVIEMVHASGWLVANNTALLLNPDSGLTWGMEARFADSRGDFAYNLTNMDILPDRDGAQGVSTGNVTNAQSAWFARPAVGDLHLAASAVAAIDRAALLAQVTDDYDGVARPIGLAPDVGADEYSPPPVWTAWVYLPLVLRSYTPPPPGLVQPGDLIYRGAFRLPGGDDPPQTFAYGGNALSFNPDGHITNTDAYSGSLFVMGHDRVTGQVPDGNQVAEISIPAPVNSRNVDDLPYASFIQGFHDAAAGYLHELDEVPKVGMQYLKHPDTGPKIHLTWGRHLQSLEDHLPSQAWINADLANPNLQGVWFIGNQDPNSVNDYMFEIPAAWADAHAQGRYLATGRAEAGGLGGMGPALLAYRPWLTGGAAPVSGTHLRETPLLLYESAMVTSIITRSMDHYQHADVWKGGAWITTSSGKSAVLFAGTKSNGIKYWYGYIHPSNNPLLPCVDVDVIGDMWPCRLADGTECPAADVAFCCTEGVDCISSRAWWSTRFDAQLSFYNPADLAQVAAGTMESWAPQPYATLDVDERLYFNPSAADRVELGWGDQRRNRLGGAAYDRTNGFLYVLELFGDGAKPVVHVWQVQG